MSAPASSRDHGEPRRSGQRLTRRRYSRIVLAALLLASAWGIAACARAIARVKPVAITFGQATLILKLYPDEHANARQQIHEAVHRLQYREQGLVRFIAAYLFDQDQRLAWEAEALAATLCYSRYRERYRVEQLAEAAVQGLQLYWVAGEIPRERAAAHLNRAYRNGKSCTPLLARVANSAPGLVYVVGAGGSAAD